MWWEAWEAWRPEAERWLRLATEDERRMCTRLQVPISPQRSFSAVPVHWRVVVGTWQFHAYQRVQAWNTSKCEVGPACVSSKRPTYVVPPVPGAPSVHKPTKRNKCNHVRGVTAVTSREKPQYRDVAPTLHDLRWQLTQANSVTATAWVLQALRQHVKTTRPRTEHMSVQAAPK